MPIRSDVLQRPGLGEALPNRRPAPPNTGETTNNGGDVATNGDTKDNKRNKKPPSLMKKFAGKVSTLSSKITELKCVQTQIQSCELLYLGNKLICICLVYYFGLQSRTSAKICFQKECINLPLDYHDVQVRSDSMKQAYAEEVVKLSTSLSSTKMELETWYAKRYEDKDIKGPVKDTYDQLMTQADSELNQYTGSIKSIRTAMAPQLNDGSFLITWKFNSPGSILQDV